MREIETFLLGAKPTYCEDALYADESVAFVLDGATGVNGVHLTDCASDAVWYVRFITNFLKTALKEPLPVLRILECGVQAVSKAYLKFEGAEKNDDKPSAAISLVRETGGMLEYYSLCDSAVVLRMRNGRVLHLRDERLIALDDANFVILKQLAAEQGKTVGECFPQIFPYVLRNRRNMNTPEGYCALAHTSAGLDTGLTGRIPLDKVRDVLLFSDGFAESYDLFGLYSGPEEAIDAVSKNGVKAEFLRLQAAQEDDPNCEKYVRNKKRDDVSIIYAKI